MNDPRDINFEGPNALPDFDEELDDAGYRRVLVADLRGDERATKYLEQDLGEWLSGLTSLHQDLEAQFASRKGNAITFQNECVQHRKKQEWFDYKADYERWRGGANSFKRRLVARLREVKAMSRDQNREQNPSYYGEQVRLLGDILGCLERIEAKLDSS
jgi:hypothetical protein